MNTTQRLSVTRHLCWHAANRHKLARGRISTDLTISSASWHIFCTVNTPKCVCRHGCGRPPSCWRVVEANPPIVSPLVWALRAADRGPSGLTFHLRLQLWANDSCSLGGFNTYFGDITTSSLSSIMCVHVLTVNSRDCLHSVESASHTHYLIVCTVEYCQKFSA